MAHNDNDVAKEMARLKRQAGVMPSRSNFHADQDARRLMELIPADTRDLTARIFGDPLPGRRAIDRRSA